MDLNRYFDYRDGHIFWKVSLSPRGLAGNKAGCLCTRSGYERVGLNGVLHMLHRVVWELHYGPIPEGMEIDHINQIRNDNRIENLRLATSTENNRNMTLSKRNSSGVMGVCRFRGKWRAVIHVSGKNIFLGEFATLHEAAAARKAADVKYNFHENHGASR